MIENRGTSVTLSGKGGSIIFQFAVNELGWSRCFFMTAEGQTMYLGAESQSYLVKRLLEGLSDHPASGTSDDVEGVPVRWILSLAEAHHVLYAAVRGPEDLCLFWIDAHTAPTRIVATIDISPRQRAEWREELERFTQSGARRRG